MHARRLKLLVFIFTAPLAASALADSDFFTPEKISADLSAGTLSGNAKESFYSPWEPGREPFLFNWKYSNAAIVRGNVDWDFMSHVSFGANGWTTLASRGSQMKYGIDNSPEDNAQLPGTSMDYANLFDLNLKGWVLDNPDYRLGLMAGYQQSAFSWSTRADDISEQFDNLGYSQKFNTPYIGLTGTYRYDKWELNGAFKFSNWVRGESNLSLSPLAVANTVHGQRYYGLTADVGYYVTENAKVFVEGSWNRMVNKKGDVSFTNYATEDNTYAPGSAGIEHSNYLVTAGLKYTF